MKNGPELSVEKLVQDFRYNKFMSDDYQGINKLLGNLSFQRTPSNLQDWRLFTREKNSRNQFAAVYREDKYLITGPYRILDTARKNLETISTGVFNADIVSRGIRNPLSYTPVSLAFCGGLTAAYLPTMNLDKMGDLAFPERAVVAVGIIGVVVLSGMGGVLAGFGAYHAFNKARNKEIASKLSPEAEQYLFGAQAKRKLEGDDFRKQCLERIELAKERKK